MFIYFRIFFFIILIIKSNQNNSYLNINNGFSYLKCNEDKSTFDIYLGNELMYINFQKSENVKFNDEYISFSFLYEGKNMNLTYPIKNTIIYYNFNGKFTFINDNNTINFIIKNNEDIKVNLEENNIIINETSKNFYLLSADVEFIFINYFALSNVLILFGCFISLYGGYYYMLFLAFHIFVLIFFFVGDIISFFIQFEIYILYFFFFCFLLGASLTLFLHINIKKRRIYTLVNLMYGGFFGFATFKIIIYYYLFFEFPIDFIAKISRIILYFILLSIFIGIGILLNYFDIFKKYKYLPCSAFCGSFYIIKGLQYIIGRYFSSILFIKENLKFINLKDEILNYSLYYFFLQVIIIVSSIFFQIKYINLKEDEFIDIPSQNDSILPSRVSDLSKFSENKEEAIVNNNKIIDNNISNENEEEEEINAQEN